MRQVGCGAVAWLAGWLFCGKAGGAWLSQVAVSGCCHSAAYLMVTVWEHGMAACALSGAGGSGSEGQQRSQISSSGAGQRRQACHYQQQWPRRQPQTYARRASTEASAVTAGWRLAAFAASKLPQQSSLTAVSAARSCPACRHAVGFCPSGPPKTPNQCCSALCHL